MADLTFVIDDNGKLTKRPDPWCVGKPGTSATIVLDNRDDRPHKVKMRKFKHKGGEELDPLSGPKSWRANKEERSDESTHKVVDHGKGYYGSFYYVIELDGVETTDPEIVVDEPPTIGPPGRNDLAVGAVIGGLLGLAGGALIGRDDDGPSIVGQQRLVTSIVLGGVCAAIGAWVAGASQRR